MKTIAMAEGLTLPQNAAVQVYAFMGRRGSGKTFAAGRLVEQVMGAGGQVLILDPVGTWYGLRLAADGKSPGISIPVFGGLHGDIPLEAGAAASWNSMREESLNTYGQDLYPAGPVSGYRSYEQQAEMYEAYLNGTAPLAAPPGTSAHESGVAVDLPTPEMRSVVDQIGWGYGWGKTEAPEEWWHINYAP